jgi:alanine dehydrogenase
MKVGVPAEVKPGERRVAVTPAAVRELVRAGVDVLIQAGAGVGSHISDDQFAAEGAAIVPDADSVWSNANIVVKVKEPQPEELQHLRSDHLLFAYLHLAPNLDLTRALQVSGATAIAFETVTDRLGRLPLLIPMSEIAGRLSAQFGVHHLVASEGGRGLLAGGIPGVAPARVLVIGGGVVGEQAARVALGLGCAVTVIDRSIARLRELGAALDGRVRTILASELDLEQALADADVVIGAVLHPGALAPHVVRAEHLALLGPGAVIVDVSIDQGGCFQTSHPTTHSQPTFIVDGVVHSCVANLPAAVPATSTTALVNATLPYLVSLSTQGLAAALTLDSGLAAGVNVMAGAIVHPAVAAALGESPAPLADLLPTQLAV